MVNFLKCKQGFITYKSFENVKIKDELVRVFFFFIKLIPVYEWQEEAEAKKAMNNPINLEYVKNISRTGGIYCGNGNYSAHYGIRFHEANGNSSYWYYDDVKTRDEQFEEIASNSHIYKSKVTI